MSVFKQKKSAGTTPLKSTESFATEQRMPIIATARTGLAGVESALVRRIPSGYAGKTVRDVLSYIVESEVKEHEAATAASLRKELGAAGTVITINGREARLTDRVDKYFVEKKKDIGGKEVQYQELEIEISAIQQGGYMF